MSCCHCDPPDMFEITEPKAIKNHICCECRREILKGEKYQRVKGLWDGEFAVYKTCSECVELANEYGEIYCFGELHYMIKESDKAFLIERNISNEPIKNQD